ncbi:MAG: hypothetical protein OEZ09_16275 [Betaproteobacteria bacterium]|nr:hypothetical protein [Betaproteobacteria bacterium]
MKKPLVVSLALMGVLLAAMPVSAKDGDVVARGSCSAQADWKLKAAPRGGTMEIEFQVDSRRVGEVWDVTIADNGSVVFTGSATTRGRSASFTVRTTTPNQAGIDTITGTASNAATGEVCIATVAA